MLKVIVDLTPITAKPSGVGLYVANLIKHLDGLQQSEQFELGIFYQPALKNWLKKNTYPDLIKGYENSFFFPYPVRVSNWLLNNFSPGISFIIGSRIKRLRSISWDKFYSL